jgi:tol-pal system protein YbgF
MQRGSLAGRSIRRTLLVDPPAYRRTADAAKDERRANMDQPPAARPRLRRGGLLAAAFAATALALLAPSGASAQTTSDLRYMSDQIRQLQQQVQQLQGQSGAGVAGAGGTAAGSVVASHEVRLQQIEEQLRNLTGRIEQADYRVQQLSDKMDKLVADVDFRLRALEQGGIPAAGASTAAAPAAPAAATAPAAAAPATPAPAASAGSESPGLAPGPSTLGKLEVNPNTGEPLLAPPSTGDTPEAQYQAAFGLLRAAKYPEAEAAFKQFLQRYPDGPLAGNAQYWIGETFYVRGDYQQAAVAFAEGYQRYPNSSKAADNLLKLSMSLSELGRNQDACAALDQLQNQFPALPSTLTQKVQHQRQRSQCS